MNKGSSGGSVAGLEKVWKCWSCLLFCKGLQTGEANISTSLLYHAFGVRDYQHLETEHVGGTVILTIQRKPETDCCARCGSDNVTRQSSVTRQFHTLPIGNRPAVSADTKKKETLGDKSNVGREYRPKGSPREVDTYDFPDREKGKAIPYGVYDIKQNEAWVSIGINCDTAEFAVEAIRSWWRELGRKRYRRPTRLLIAADCGGGNGHRNRLWKIELQKLANKTGMTIEVCHYPPGTSKWNKIEHRLFCHITRNWRGVPLEAHELVVNLVSST